jgi:hypothetical protein
LTARSFVPSRGRPRRRSFPVMNPELGPSRIGDVLQPILLAGVIFATASCMGLLLAYDPPAASTVLRIVFLPLLFSSIFLISAYLVSIGAQGLANRSMPVLGVGAAAAGCAGFAAMIGVAAARPSEPLVGFLGLATGLGLIALNVAVRLRGRRGR